MQVGGVWLPGWMLSHDPTFCILPLAHLTISAPLWKNLHFVSLHFVSLHFVSLHSGRVDQLSYHGPINRGSQAVIFVPSSQSATSSGQLNASPEQPTSHLNLTFDAYSVPADNVTTYICKVRASWHFLATLQPTCCEVHATITVPHLPLVCFQEHLSLLDGFQTA